MLFVSHGRKGSELLPQLWALNRKPMAMADWIAKLDDFLRLSDRDVLAHAGRASHEQAMAFASEQFERYRQARMAAPTSVERDFEEATRTLKVMAGERKPGRGEKGGDG